MEIILAIVVVTAVILFGALISMGNERQRKAIDGLREQVVLWAVQDLKIKRKHQVQMVQVPDPLGWLNKVASKVCGYDLKLQGIEAFQEPQSLICTSSDSNIKVVFSPHSPADIRRINSGRKSRLSQFAGQNPLFYLSKGVIIHELSVLNNSQLFDLELSYVWKAITDQNLDSVDSLWAYIIS